MSNPNIIRERIDNGPVTPTMLLVVAIGFLLSLVDGFDVIAMSVSAPYLSVEWGVSRAELGPIFSAALIGMAVGAALLAPFADKYGRRLILLLATISIGISMIVTGLLPKSIILLVIVRFIAGLGVGVIFANAATIASEFAPARYKHIAVTTAIMGYASGATVVGPVANMIIPAQGWEMLFIYGGIATLIMGAFIHFSMPESVDYLASRKENREANLVKINEILKRLKREPIDEIPEHAEAAHLKAASVKSILNDDFRGQTLALWTTYFMGFMTLYFLLSWIPTLFVDSGYERSAGIDALSYFNLGAVVGIIAIGLIATKIKLAKPIALFFLGSAIFLIYVYFDQPKALLALNTLIFIIGFLLQGAFTALYALAAHIYPTKVRATGVGWAAGLGRVGAIVAPIIAGLLTASGWDMHGLFLLFSVPLLIAAAMVARFKV
ncbi:MFS transporter [Emcibacter sp.]|uniref:MFS transporter n=1 Tax=Emcibacter sp. TaxID=1979954 RepID=UPI002AA8020E|nr:MFS transporter [Emcibacter sp.]